MTAYGLEDMVDVAGITTGLMTAFLLVLLLSQARADVVGPRLPWALLTVCMVLVSARAFGHFYEAEWFQYLRRTSGMIISLLLPLALYLMSRRAKATGEASPHARP